MSAVAFWVAFAMLAYDFIGHLWGAAADGLARQGVEWPARLWNAYAPHIWPINPDRMIYDRNWALWHGITLVLLLFAWMTRD